MKHRKPTGEIELCARCGKNPRRPFSDNCPSCSAEIRAQNQRDRREAARKNRRPKQKPCKCGCGVLATFPAQYATADCKRVGRSVSVKEYNAKRKGKPVDHPERFGLKPHRPAKVITLSKEESDALDAEQERLNAEASAADRAWHAQFMKNTLGLESAPGQPLASKAVRPPPEVFKQLEEAYRPLSSHEREIFIPARADISY